MGAVEIDGVGALARRLAGGVNPLSDQQRVEAALLEIVAMDDPSASKAPHKGVLGGEQSGVGRRTPSLAERRMDRVGL